MGRPKKKKVADLEWFVYRYNVNTNKIEPFNIFNHWKLCEDLQKSLKKCATKGVFVEQMRRELSYYFWSKAEYELIVQLEDDKVFLLPWCGCRNPEEAKIEVSDDEYNWLVFAKYYINRVYGDEAKIDIYEQVMWCWQEFCDYACSELGVE